MDCDQIMVLQVNGSLSGKLQGQQRKITKDLQMLNWKYGREQHLGGLIGLLRTSISIGVLSG